MAMNILETYAKPLREENARLSEAYNTVNRKYDAISREKAQLEEEKKKYEAKTKKYEAIIKALKDELASKGDSDKEV